MRIVLSSFNTMAFVVTALSLSVTESAHAECPNLLGTWEAPRIVNGVSTHARTLPTKDGITPDCSYAWVAARAPRQTVSVTAKAPPLPSRR
jgi:hypothetical protein